MASAPGRARRWRPFAFLLSCLAGGAIAAEAPGARGSGGAEASEAAVVIPGSCGAASEERFCKSCSSWPEGCIECTDRFELDASGRCVSLVDQVVVTAGAKESVAELLAREDFAACFKAVARNLTGIAGGMVRIFGVRALTPPASVVVRRRLGNGPTAKKQSVVRSELSEVYMSMDIFKEIVADDAEEQSSQASFPTTQAEGACPPLGYVRSQVVCRGKSDERDAAACVAGLVESHTGGGSQAPNARSIMGQHPFFRQYRFEVVYAEECDNVCGAGFHPATVKCIKDTPERGPVEVDQKQCVHAGIDIKVDEKPCFGNKTAENCERCDSADSAGNKVELRADGVPACNKCGHGFMSDTDGGCIPFQAAITLDLRAEGPRRDDPGFLPWRTRLSECINDVIVSTVGCDYCGSVNVFAAEIFQVRGRYRVLATFVETELTISSDAETGLRALYERCMKCRQGVTTESLQKTLSAENFNLATAGLKPEPGCPKFTAIKNAIVLCPAGAQPDEAGKCEKQVERSISFKFHYSVTNWSLCTNQCGEGSQTRTLGCRIYANNNVWREASSIKLCKVKSKDQVPTPEQRCFNEKPMIDFCAECEFGRRTCQHCMDGFDPSKRGGKCLNRDVELIVGFNAMGQPDTAWREKWRLSMDDCMKAIVKELIGNATLTLVTRGYYVAAGENDGAAKPSMNITALVTVPRYPPALESSLVSKLLGAKMPRLDSKICPSITAVRDVEVLCREGYVPAEDGTCVLQVRSPSTVRPYGAPIAAWFVILLCLISAGACVDWHLEQKRRLREAILPEGSVVRPASPRLHSAPQRPHGSGPVAVQMQQW